MIPIQATTTAIAIIVLTGTEPPRRHLTTSPPRGPGCRPAAARAGGGEPLQQAADSGDPLTHSQEAIAGADRVAALAVVPHLEEELAAISANDDPARLAPRGARRIGRASWTRRPATIATDGGTSSRPDPRSSSRPAGDEIDPASRVSSSGRLTDSSRSAETTARISARISQASPLDRVTCSMIGPAREMGGHLEVKVKAVT